MRHSRDKPAIIFVPSRRQAQLTAIDLMSYRETLDDKTFLGKDADINSLGKDVKEAALQQVLSAGVGFLHENMADSDWDCVTNLYRDGIIRVLVCPFDLCWKLQESSHLVVIMGTETYN